MATWKKKFNTFIKDHHKMILFFILFSTLVAVFLVLAGEITGKRLLAFDEPILLFIHSYASPFLDTFFTVITHLGDTIIILLLAMTLSLYFMYKRMFQKALIIFLSISGTVGINIILKSLFQRDRPTLWHHIVNEANFSFPSGHAMLSAALAATLIVIFWHTRYRRTVMLIATVSTALVGLSRLYLGVHYPSDILAGWCVSVAWVLLTSMTIYFFQKKQLVSSHRS